MAIPTSKGKKSPIWLHPSGQWCRKHKGVFHYFGTDYDEALRRYAAEWDDRRAGVVHPRRDAGEPVRLRDVVNEFLAEKRGRVDSGELAARSWADYYATCADVVAAFGKNRDITRLGPKDFAELRASMAARVNVVSLTGFIVKARMIFTYAFDIGLIDRPVVYGKAFDRPKKESIRKHKKAKGKKDVTAADAWKLIDAADPQLRAMILLGLNGGMGATDCSTLTRSILEARPGWIDHPRAKTATERRFPLWPETVAALAAAETARPDPKDPANADRVFLTRTGKPWVRFDGSMAAEGDEGRRSTMDAVAWQFTKLAKRVGVRASFYAMRHTFRTQADAVLDRGAVDLIMGHTNPTMADHYVHHIADERLQAVVDHVRAWLLTGKPAA